MNTDSARPSSLECAGYAALLPQLRHDALDPSVATSLRAHLERCPFCQAQLAAYDQLDAKLRSYTRRFASTAPVPDAIIHAALTTSTTTQVSDATPMHDGAAPSRKPLLLSDSSRKQPVPQEGTSMRFTRQHPLVATVAALLVIVMAAALFTTFTQPRLGGLTGKPIHSTPTVQSVTATSLPITRAISAQQAWGPNAAARTIDTQIDATHAFEASALSPDGKLILGYQTLMQGTTGTQEQAGYYDIATHHFTAIGLSQPWPEPPGCCQTDGRYLLAVLDTAPGTTCGLCHRIYYSYDMHTRQLWQIAKGTDYDMVNVVHLDRGLVLLSTGQGLFQANLATHTVARLPLPTASPSDVHLEAFAWPYLVYTAPTTNSSTSATRAYNLTTQADMALPQFDNLRVKGGIVAAVTGDTLFITQTTYLDATHATTTLFEDDAFLASSAPPHALATYNDQLGLGVVAANTRLVAFSGLQVWDRVEQRLVTLASDGQRGSEVSVVLSGHFLAVIQTNASYGVAMPQRVTIYDTDTLPTAPSP